MGTGDIVFVNTFFRKHQIILATGILNFSLWSPPIFLNKLVQSWTSPFAQKYNVDPYFYDLIYSDFHKKDKKITNFDFQSQISINFLGSYEAQCKLNQKRLCLHDPVYIKFLGSTSEVMLSNTFLEVYNQA